MINENLDIKKLREEYLKNKVVRINDFLDTDFAYSVHNFFSEDMPRDWWSLSTYPRRPSIVEENLDIDCLRLFEDPQTQSILKYKKDIADRYFQLGHFSYSFKRTLDDHEDCDCGECQLRNYISSPEVINFINQITQSNVTTADELFSSLYEEGDFLSIHHDGPNGKLGFVYNLCPDWLPDWGGLLHTLDDDRKKVINTYVPGFNTLTLFDSSDDTGYPHYVSHVVNKKSKRISFTGWYK